MFLESGFSIHAAAGWVHCGRFTIREEGVLALFHGLRPTLARAFLVNGAIFSVYEALMKLMHSHDPADAAHESITLSI